MRQRSRFFKANIVLGIIFAAILGIDFGIFRAGREAFNAIEAELEMAAPEDFYWSEDWESDYEAKVYPLPSMEQASVSLIGDEYQGRPAQDGYHFYEVKVLVHNAGTEYLITDYLNIFCEGEAEGDVYMEYEGIAEGAFAYTNMEIIPSCQTAEKVMLIQVKDGTEKIMLYLYEDYESKEYQSMELQLK